MQERNFMLVKATNLIGLPVITLDTGEKIETIKDILYNLHTNLVEGLLIDAGGWFSKAKVILTQNIQSLGEDAVMIPSTSAVNTANEIEEEVAQIAKDGEYLTKTKIVTETGKELGNVSDLYFTLPDGAVEKLEVSQNLVQDAAKGKATISVNDIVKIGKDATIVSAAAAQALKEQSAQGGAQALTQQAQQQGQTIFDAAKTKAEELSQQAQKKYQETSNDPQVQAKVADAKTKAQEIAQTVTQKAKEAGQYLKEKTTNATDTAHEMAIEAAVGKYVTKNVLAKDDSIIAKRGDMITHEMIARAREEGVEQELHKNTSTEPVAV